MSETQFNYNRTTLSEYGRYMGPVFTMFTKWPLSIAGDVRSKLLNEKQYKKAATKYLGPLAAFTAADAMLSPEAFRDWDDRKPALREKMAKKHLPRIDQRELDLYGDRYKKIVGSGGFSAWAPIYNLESLVGIPGGEGLLSPPVVDTIMGGYEAATSDKSSAKFFDRFTRQYTPGAGVAKLFLDDIPTLVDGKRPKGMFWRKGTEEALKRPVEGFGRRGTGIDFYKDLFDE